MIREDNQMRKITGIFWYETEYELMKDEEGFFVKVGEEITRLKGVRMSKSIAFQYIDFLNKAVVALGGNTFGYFSGFNKYDFPAEKAWDGSLIAMNYKG